MRPRVRGRIEFVAVAGNLVAGNLVAGNLVVGQAAISNISRAPVYLDCTIGYSVDEQHQGRGIATALVRHAVLYAITREDVAAS